MLLSNEWPSAAWRCTVLLCKHGVQSARFTPLNIIAVPDDKTKNPRPPDGVMAESGMRPGETHAAAFKRLRGEDFAHNGLDDLRSVTRPDGFRSGRTAWTSSRARTPLFARVMLKIGADSQTS
jgi:hypothetical protein